MAFLESQVKLELSDVKRVSFNVQGTRAFVCCNDLTTIEDTGNMFFGLLEVSGQNARLPTFQVDEGLVYDARWSSDERHVVCGTSACTVRIFDTLSGVCESFFNLSNRGVVCSVAWCHGDRFVLVGLNRGDVEIWDVASGRVVRVLTGHSDMINMLDVSTDQQYLLSSSRDRSCRFWHLESGTCGQVLRGHNESVLCAALETGARRALSGSMDPVLRVWDLITGNCLCILEGHSAAITTVAWHPVIRALAVSGSEDLTVRVWNVDQGTCVQTLAGYARSVQSYMLWSPNRERLFTADRDGTIVTWDFRRLMNDFSGSLIISEPNDNVHYTSAKVLLVGDSAAGKTGLSMRLAHNNWQPTDSTVGAWSTRWSLGNAVDATGRGQREIWLWDFGGQHDQRLVHQLFMDDTALALLVFDGQRDGVLDALRQWDRDILRASRAGCRKLLVAGRVDAGAPRMPRSNLLQFATRHQFLGYFETSAKDGTGCEDLKQAIRDGIDWDKIPWRSSPVIFKNLKDAIIALKDVAVSMPVGKGKVSGDVLLRIEELRANLHAKLGAAQFTDEQLKAVLSLLSGPGVVWELKFGGYYLLHPELVGSYLQGLLRQDRLEFGYAKESDVFAGLLPDNVPRLDDATKDRLLLLELHHTLLERALCYREVTRDMGPILIFPTRFVAEPPEAKWQPPVVVSYTFIGYVDEAYATLVVRLHHTEPFQDAELFRDYARFTTTSGQVGVKIKRLADPFEFEVFREPVVADGTVVEFCAFVHEHLLQYDQDVKRLRQFVCVNCGTVVTNREAVMIKIKRYNDAAKPGVKVAKPSVVCALCDRPVILWDTLEEHYSRADYQVRVRELQDYSKSKLQRQADERVLIANIISVVLQAGHQIEELSFPELGASLKVTLQPEGSFVTVVLSTAKPTRTSGPKHFIEDDVLQFAPEWMARRLRVVLVLSLGDRDIQWTPLSGVRIANQRVEFQGRRLNVNDVRGWKDLPTATAVEGAGTAATAKPVAVPWTTRTQRFDVFLSFRGNEPLGARGSASTVTIRDRLVTALASDLRRTRSVYFDETGLADQMAAAPGTEINDILQGVMSTQGGGVAALLISRTYFERRWTTLELAACVTLHTARQVRLLPFLLGDGVTPEWVKGQPFMREICPALSSVQMHTVPPGDADAMRAFIKARIDGALGDDGIAGATMAHSFSALKITIANRLRGLGDRDTLSVALIHRAPQPHETLLSVLDNVPTLSSSNITPLRDAIWRYFNTDGFRDLCDLVDRYEFKWHVLATSSGAVTDLGAVKARVDDWWLTNGRA